MTEEQRGEFAEMPPGFSAKVHETGEIVRVVTKTLDPDTNTEILTDSDGNTWQTRPYGPPEVDPWPTPEDTGTESVAEPAEEEAEASSPTTPSYPPSGGDE